MRPNLKQLARVEREELAELLAGLSARQWEADSLCAGWRVRDVVAHALSYEELSFGALSLRFLRGGLRPDRINAIGLAEYAEREPAELLELLRAHLEPRGFTAAFGGMIGFADALIHQQDIRRPLGIPREIPEQRLRPALYCALFAPVLLGVLRVRGLRLVATDIEWSFGRGPEVRGPAESLLLAIAGRECAVAELSGPGRSTLEARFTAKPHR